MNPITKSSISILSLFLKENEAYYFVDLIARDTRDGKSWGLEVRSYSDTGFNLKTNITEKDYDWFIYLSDHRTEGLIPYIKGAFYRG
jgi:hypothetical protein